MGLHRSTTQSFLQQMSSPNLAPRTALFAEDTNVNRTKVSALGDYPGGPVVKIPCFHCRGCGFDPNQGSKIPHAAWCVQKKKSELDNSIKDDLRTIQKRMKLKTKNNSVLQRSTGAKEVNK